MILREKFLHYVAQTSPEPQLIEVERAEGLFFYTPCGKRYFDLISGVSVSNVGHGNKEVVEAVKQQAERYMHIMVYGEMVYSPQVEYAERLVGCLGEPFGSVYFVNSGTEAVEGALKTARRYTSRSEIVAMRNAYHGSTFGSMSVMGGREYEQAFGPLLGGIKRIGFNSREDLEQITELSACVLVEPVQGEGGVRLPDEGYLQALRNRCDQTGTLLIFDEIQTGMGRTGEMFAMQKYGVRPDIVCLAKALGGGMPLGAFVGSQQIMECLTHDPVLGHITTFGGHPVCCAAGLAAMKYIEREHLTEQVEEKGALFEKLLSEHRQVREIRRSGLLMAVELGQSDKLYRIMSLFIERGILSDWFLFCDTAFRISPPLTITTQQIEECCQLIKECLDCLDV